MAPFPPLGGTLVASRVYGAIASGYLAVNAGDALKVLHIGSGESRGWFYASKEADEKDCGWLPMREFLPAGRGASAGPELDLASDGARPAQPAQNVGPPRAAAAQPAAAEAAQPAASQQAQPTPAQPTAAQPTEPTARAAASSTSASGGLSRSAGAAAPHADTPIVIARHPVDDFIGSRKPGFLVPVEKGEELHLLWQGPEADPDFQKWAYARRIGPPYDAGWVLKEVLCDGTSDAKGAREEDERGRDRTPRSGAAAAPWAVGDVAYHLRTGGGRSHLHTGPGGTGGGAVRADADADLAGEEVLEHNERVQVAEVEGAWAKVCKESGAGGWVRVTHLRHAPVPVGPPPTSSRATSRATSRASSTSRRRVTFDEEEVVAVSPDRRS